MVVSSLKPGIVTLMKNMNGNHVAQRCLQHLTPQYREVRITCLVHLISFQLSMCINRYICVKKKKDVYPCCMQSGKQVNLFVIPRHLGVIFSR